MQKWVLVAVSRRRMLKARERGCAPGYAKGYLLGPEGYADLRGEFSRSYFARQEVRAAFGHSQRILDLGSGRGGSAEGPLASCAGKVVLLEPSLAELRHARRRIVGRGLWARCAGVVCGSAETLPFRDGVFDGISLIDVVEHFPDWRLALAEVNRVASRTCAQYVQFSFLLNAGHSHLGDLLPIAHAELFSRKDAILEAYRQMASEHLDAVPGREREGLKSWFEWHYIQHRSSLNRLLPGQFDRFLSNRGWRVVAFRSQPVPGYLSVVLRAFWPWCYLRTRVNIYVLSRVSRTRIATGRLLRSEARAELAAAFHRRMALMKERVCWFRARR